MKKPLLASRKELFFPIIIFLILTSWTKNQQSPVENLKVSASLLLLPSKKRAISKKENSAWNILVQSNTSASLAAKASYALNAWLTQIIFSTM